MSTGWTGDLQAIYLSLRSLARDVETIDRHDIREWVETDTGTLERVLNALGIDVPTLDPEDGDPDLISDDDFMDRYEPLDTYATGDPAWLEADNKCVWSIVEGDTGDLYAVPGVHVVNVVSMLVTKHPWEHEGLIAEWLIFEED